MRLALRSVTSLVALAGFIANFALPFVVPSHATIVDADAGWNLPVVAHGSEVVAPAGGQDAEHCAICHWMRALDNTVVAAGTRRLPPAKAVPQTTAPIALPRTTVVSDCPARAPPVSIA